MSVCRVHAGAWSAGVACLIVSLAMVCPNVEAVSSSRADDQTGRETWYFWTAGNEAFWRQLAVITHGNVDLLQYSDSRRHQRRFEELGVLNDPGCVEAAAPDQYGLWLDDCSRADRSQDIPGVSAGIVGLRRFDNPMFVVAKWRVEDYTRDPASVEPPYRIGMTCAFCHAALNPINPPLNPNHASWSNISATIGNQYFQEGKLFSMRLTPSDFRWHVANRQPPGTSDTSRFATDHINNPGAINSIFGLADRPTFQERMSDGSMREVHHILKDGADSIGLTGAALRVYVNIGMCSDYSTTLHDPIAGVKTVQRPFDLTRARTSCEAFRKTENRMPAVASFLMSGVSPKLAEAPGGAGYLSSDEALVRRGKLAFAYDCAECHSSKQPPAGLTDKRQWFREAVLRDDFFRDNFLSNDVRYPVTRIGTNIGRAVASNAAAGHIWAQFSSETYKGLPSAGTLANLFNPRDPRQPITFVPPAGGRGYYRPPSLIGVWATAPYLHNNSIGTFTRNPSVTGRMAAFLDGMEKLLWPERRLGVQSIPTTTTDSAVPLPGTSRVLRVPMGTPIDYIARVDPVGLARAAAGSPAVNLALRLTPNDALLDSLLKRNLAPDFILDRGHTFGADLSDDDKRALIEFLKRL